MNTEKQLLLSKFRQLVLKSHAGPRFEHRLRRLLVRLGILSLARSQYVTDWVDMLQFPMMEKILNAHPRLSDKAFRPYIHCGMPTDKRHRAVIDQYKWLLTHLNPQLLEQVFLGNGAEVGRFSLEDGSFYHLVIKHLPRFDMEGEFTLCLVRGSDNKDIFYLTFALMHAGEEIHGYIGGLQGGQDSAEQIREITRHMHGLRPPAILLFTLRELLRHAGITRLLAVRNASHVYRCLSFKSDRKRRIQMDYESIWMESGGTVLASNPKFVELPLETVDRPLEEVPSKKRAMYRRRQQFLRELGEAIHVNILQLTEKPG